MIPPSSSRRLIRSDPTCRETGHRMHQNGDAGERQTQTIIPPTYFNSLYDNTLPNRTGQSCPARIVHSLQIGAHGRREIRPSTIEER